MALSPENLQHGEKNVFLPLETDKYLLEQLKVAALTKQSIPDIFEQRVSFVYGSLGRNNTTTKEQIRQILKES